MVDVKVLRLAGRQRSLVTRRQLLEPGCPKSLIEAWLDAGDDAVASHASAGALFGLRRVTCEAVEVTVPGRRAPKTKGLVAHRSDRLPASDRTVVGVVPVTTPARTVLDLAAVLDRSRLGGVVDDVLVRRLTSLGAIERLLDRSAGERRPGARVLAGLVAERRRGTKPSETGLEDELIEVFRAYRLPEPVRQFVLPLPGGGSARFDAAYPDLLVGFEADGDAFHKGILDRMRDEARDEQCGQIGWTVGRYTTDDIRLRPAGIADEVARLHRGTEAA